MTKTKNLILEVIETPLTTARSEGKSRTAKEGNGRKGGRIFNQVTGCHLAHPL